jgi:uncharacterized small protein (DUF1192 family)
MIGRSVMELEDLEPRNQTRKPKDLSNWSFEDLEAYIAAMEAEIVRARDAIAKKAGVASVADSLFKR